MFERTHFFRNFYDLKQKLNFNFNSGGVGHFLNGFWASELALIAGQSFIIIKNPQDNRFLISGFEITLLYTIFNFMNKLYCLGPELPTQAVH